MNEETYLKDRLDDQICWYSKKSASNKQLYYAFKILEIITAAIIPFLSGLTSEQNNFKYATGALGVIVSALAGLFLIFKFEKKWTQYRSTSEMLKHEKYLFLAKTGPYQNDKPFATLVERVEHLISKENSDWGEYIIQVDKKNSR